MSITLLLLKQSGIMLIYLLIGYFLYRKNLVSKQGSADMGRMLLYIIMPMAIVKSYIYNRRNPHVCQRIPGGAEQYDTAGASAISGIKVQNKKAFRQWNVCPLRAAW